MSRDDSGKIVSLEVQDTACANRDVSTSPSTLVFSVRAKRGSAYEILRELLECEGNVAAFLSGAEIPLSVTELQPNRTAKTTYTFVYDMLRARPLFVSFWLGR